MVSKTFVGRKFEFEKLEEYLTDVLQNNYFKKVLETAKKETQKGEPISKAFKDASKLYPLLVGEMMAVGAETGELSEMMKRLAIFYEEEIGRAHV